MPTTWSDYVLIEFPGEDDFARMTLVEDPDTLLADEAIFSKLNERPKEDCRTMLIILKMAWFKLVRHFEN